MTLNWKKVASEFAALEEHSLNSRCLSDLDRKTKFQSALSPHTAHKNRYPDILPYEETRVILRSSQLEGSDYINANFILDRYISCQAPIYTTFFDFWRMVWEQNTTVIVMLTRLMEAGRTKAHVYWPTCQGEPQMFGDIVVTLIEEQTNEFYKVRKFQIASQNTTRELTHFHYTDWPDFGVPKTTMGILRLCYHTSDCLMGGGPMIVHCSAGIGRSGSFIGIHYLISSSETNSTFFLSNITVLELTKKMRQQRPGMVQTVDQYRFIYQAVNDFVKASLRMNNSEGGNSSKTWRLSAERLQTMITGLV